MKHALNLLGQFFHAGRTKDFHIAGNCGDFNFNFAIIKLAFTQHLAELLSRGVLFLRRACGGIGSDIAVLGVAVEIKAACFREQRIEHTLLGVVLGQVTNLLCFLLARLLDGDFGEITNDRIDIPTDVPDFGELGGLDFEEGRVRELGQTPRDLGLADAGRPDHQNIFWRDLGP